MSKNKGDKVKKHLVYHHSIETLNGLFTVNKYRFTEEEIQEFIFNEPDKYLYSTIKIDGHINCYSIHKPEEELKENEKFTKEYADELLNKMLPYLKKIKE